MGSTQPGAGSADGNDDGLLRTIASRLRTEAKTRMPIWRSGSEGERCELRTEAGELLTLAQLIGEGLVVQEGVKKHTRYRLHGVAL